MGVSSLYYVTLAGNSAMNKKCVFQLLTSDLIVDDNSCIHAEDWLR